MTLCVVPLHPEYPVTLTELSPEATVTFSLDGVTVVLGTVTYRMERGGSVPWTVEYSELGEP